MISAISLLGKVADFVAHQLGAKRLARDADKRGQACQLITRIYYTIESKIGPTFASSIELKMHAGQFPSGAWVTAFLSGPLLQFEQSLIFVPLRG
ncbi:MAG: hypothetical protein ACLQU4_07155 [Limisphaerales bacterium]